MGPHLVEGEPSLVAFPNDSSISKRLHSEPLCVIDDPLYGICLRAGTDCAIPLGDRLRQA